MFKLNSTLQCLLLNQPESGMGYQIVEAVTADHKTKRGIAYNASCFYSRKSRARCLEPPASHNF